MILLKDVTKIYDNGCKALDNINLNIEKGEFVFLVGPSGAGKSTLTKLLMREEIASTGQVLVNGTDVTNIKGRDIPYHRRKIGMVFQDYRLLQGKNIYDNVAFAMRIVGASDRQIRRQVPMILSMVGLSLKSKVFPHELSGGEQQRVSLARALVNNPELLIADEPTGNLDPLNASEIVNLISEINKRGTTIIIATHAKDIVNDLKKRVVAIENGQIVRDEERGAYGYET